MAAAAGEDADEPMNVLKTAMPCRVAERQRSDTPAAIDSFRCTRVRSLGSSRTLQDAGRFACYSSMWFRTPPRPSTLLTARSWLLLTWVRSRNPVSRYRCGLAAGIAVHEARPSRRKALNWTRLRIFRKKTGRGITAHRGRLRQCGVR